MISDAVKESRRERRAAVIAHNDMVSREGDGFKVTQPDLRGRPVTHTVSRVQGEVVCDCEDFGELKAKFQSCEHVMAVRITLKKWEREAK